MYIIAGLGNPGKKYENTRHNLGFITVDLLAEKHGVKINKIKNKALVGECTISGQKVLFVKPQTYMNLSGSSIREIMAFYKEEPEHLIVIYDDIDIPMGTIRLRKKGSAGTHNGMRSIIYDLQYDDFPRIRVGIGRDKRGELVDYVIGNFSKEDRPLLEAAVEKAAEAAECIVSEGIDIAMNRFNVKPAGKEKDAEEKPAEEKPAGKGKDADGAPEEQK